MSPLALAMLELRRFRGHPLRAAALAGLALVPILVGGIALWSVWDPHGRLDRLPVALVNDDRGAQTATGAETTAINAGDVVADRLRVDPIFDWHLTDAREAADGLAEGRYHLVLTVPADFSAALAESRPSAVEVVRDEHAAAATATAEARLRDQIDGAVTAAFAESSGGDRVETVGGARTGAERLEGGLAEVADRAEDVAEGALRVSGGVERLLETARPLVDDLARDWSQIQRGGAAGAALADRAATDLDEVYADLCEGRGGSACASLKRYVDDAALVNTDIRNGNDAAKDITEAELRGAATELGELETGITDLADDAEALADGAAEAHAGAGDLADGLERLGPTGAHGPVTIVESDRESAVAAGRALAPAVIAAALWAFALPAYLLLRPANRRALAGPLRSSAIALGGWMPGAVLGTAAAIALYAALDLGLGLDPEHRLGTIGVCVLAVLVFTAIAHVLTLAFGAAGPLVLLALLMVQLVASGGLFPVETAPGLFAAIHPWLPMTYVVDGLRVSVGGGGADLGRAVAVLAAGLVATLALACLVVAWHRRWSAGRLHPPLGAFTGR